MPGLLLVKIGILPALRADSGGMYQYSLTMLDQLAEILRQGRRRDELVVFTSGDPRPSRNVALPDWEWLPIHPPSAKGMVSRAAKRLVPPGAIRSQLSKASVRAFRRHEVAGAVIDRSDVRGWLQRLGIDLMLYPAPDPRCFEIGIPFVMAIHDLQHRLQPQFPEVGEPREHARREYLYKNAVKAATVLLVDSDVGKADLLDLYTDCGVSADRVFVLPFLPPPYLTVETADAADSDSFLERLPTRFCFYPAQFWPHKNHQRLVQALAELRDRGVEVPVVLTGSATGSLRAHTYRAVMELARERGIEGQIHWYGYVDNSQMAALYRRATALLFPTFFGPTNIPVLEAWSLGCAVLTSDVRGIREQVGDAALLVDPASSASIAEGVLSLWTDKDRRDALAVAGFARLRSYTAEDYRERLVRALDFAEQNLKIIDRRSAEDRWRA